MEKLVRVLHAASLLIMPSLACSFNVYNDNWALPGMLENASQWADDIYCIHASPGAKPSTDGTMETLEKWGIKPIMADIADGFGVIRSRLVHEHSCDWCLIVDADERVPVLRHTMTCSGTDKYPDNHNPNLVVHRGQAFDQMKALKSLIDSCEGQDAIVMPRYHFMDAGFKRPSQNFCDIKDLQCRCIRNVKHVGFNLTRKLHEQIVDYRTGNEPQMFRQNPHEREIVFYHLHNHFKPMSPAKNAEDLQTYKNLDAGLVSGMWLESAKMS